MSASPPLIGSLPLKKRTQRQGSPSADPGSAGQRQQRQQQCGSPPPPSPTQSEHKFKVPAPYRNPSRVWAVRERARARPDRTPGSLVAPTPLYYQFWDQSYLAVPRHHSTAPSFSSSGDVSAAWREQYSSDGHSGDWAQGRHIQGALATSPGESIDVNYLTRHPPNTASSMQGYTYRDSLFLSGHRRQMVTDTFHTHRSPGGEAATYQSNGVPSWDRWGVPPVRTNQLLYGSAKVSRHDSFRRKKERYLGDGESTKATVARFFPAWTVPPGNEKPTNGNATTGLCVSDSSRAAKQYLSSHAAGYAARKSKQREESSKNSEVVPLLVGSGSAAEPEAHRQNPRKHRTERKSTISASAFGFYSLHNFAVGSLIELSSGQHKRVEDLQTEDFLVCADACPEIHLRSCTVRHIAPSSDSPELVQVVIQLDDQHTQDCLEVFVGFPFFVYGRGWASCNPQMTARLCGLGCHQLGVGDVCLALSPSPSTSTPPTETSRDPQGNQEKREGEDKKEKAAELGGKEHTVRKRHSSAPQFCTTD